jgi:hypothetical protein
MATPKETALSACRQLMEPIIGILLRNGITYKDLSLLCKQVFVKVATEQFGIRGRPTNLSRVAMLTGIDRKEVARIKDSLADDDANDSLLQHQDRLTRLLSGWYQDADFLDDQGQPRSLDLEGDTASFALLARRYGGDLPSSALLKELKRAGLVEDTSDQRLRPLGRYFLINATDPAALLRAGSVLRDLGSAIEHNLYKSQLSKDPQKHFERRAINTEMPAETAAAFRAFVEQEGQAFLEKIDAWLSQHETPNATGPRIRLGVGAYLIDDRLAPEPPAHLGDSTDD